MEVEILSTPKPNWLELPRDITINILQRLSTLEIVTSASVVCPLWRDICKHPRMWHTIDMITGISLSHANFPRSRRLGKICRYAVEQSCGDLKNINIKKFGTNDLLLYIANRANQLRSMRLEECHEISNEAFKEFVKKQPFLEELDNSHCFELRTCFFKYVGQCCPLLKSLKFSHCQKEDYKCDNVAFSIAKTMPMLRHLTLLNDGVTNNGLLAILDGCPFLESLDIRGCLHLDLDGSLGKRCNEQIKELRLPTESIDDSFDISDYMNILQFKLLCEMI